ncbi:uncharacterized protein si:dkey-118j18.2 isoform X2 [Notolabrus celidotus]|uniref:uncharacterized protein si:dkey-118j18.2 isoform X2 n=1 Tax=Notolabrus celidotus TaxID=1203425 RepID=UPI00148F6461|nr:uncharacterized protein si:dkey-118j18.2 isoform X2 [Notolabrus celidotus]
MELYWYIVVIIFIIIKIFFYVCWYRSRQRQLAAYLSNPRNAQIVIVGGRAYLHQMCERQSQTSVWPSWYGVQDDLSIEEPSTALPPAASFSNLDMPPPYEAVSGDLRCTHKSRFPKLRRWKCNVAKRPILISCAHLLRVHHGSHK